MIITLPKRAYLSLRPEASRAARDSLPPLSHLVEGVKPKTKIERPTRGVTMKGRHQFRRRFSLQPSFLKEEPEDDRHHHNNRCVTTTGERERSYFQARICGTTTTGEREEGEELQPGREAVSPQQQVRGRGATPLARSCDTTTTGEREEGEELLPGREAVTPQQQVRGRRERSYSPGEKL
ncbi:unnamed protein product [Timema podura]|uniref:Uncharacterized protein n=1 Tax=Timema podura TaxID=61482 RepID=A0ABN7NNG7_TIMPD|nr:unnamed protein product [Timema podura]